MGVRSFRNNQSWQVIVLGFTCSAIAKSTRGLKSKKQFVGVDPLLVAIAVGSFSSANYLSPGVQVSEQLSADLRQFFERLPPLPGCATMPLSAAVAISASSTDVVDLTSSLATSLNPPTPSAPVGVEEGGSTPPSSSADGLLGRTLAARLPQPHTLPPGGMPARQLSPPVASPCSVTDERPQNEQAASAHP